MTTASPRGGLLAEEVRLWNTPLMGGYLLWEFTLGYCESHPYGDAPHGILHFIAAPILSSPQLRATVSNRRANLQSYVSGFEDKKQVDLLLSLQDRVIMRRANTFAAIDAAVCAGFLVWDVESGKLYPRESVRKPSRGKSIRPAVVQEGARARILGKWFSGHDISAISTYLKVSL